MTAAESLAADGYAEGYLDGLSRRPMANDGGPGRRRFTARDLAEVLEQGRRLGRAETGVDAEVLTIVERLNSQLKGRVHANLTEPARTRRSRSHLRRVK